MADTKTDDDKKEALKEYKVLCVSNGTKSIKDAIIKLLEKEIEDIKNNEKQDEDIER